MAIALFYLLNLLLILFPLLFCFFSEGNQIRILGTLQQIQALLISLQGNEGFAKTIVGFKIVRVMLDSDLTIFYHLPIIFELQVDGCPISM